MEEKRKRYMEHQVITSSMYVLRCDLNSIIIAVHWRQENSSLWFSCISLKQGFAEFPMEGHVPSFGSSHVM